MGKFEKLIERILRGKSDANFAFKDLCNLLRRLGFEERTRGSHHVFTRADISDLITLQADGSKAVPYQVRQVRRFLIRFGLVDELTDPAEESSGQSTESDDAEQNDGDSNTDEV